MVGEDHKALLAAVATLPPRAGRCWPCAATWTWPNPEIAAALGVSKATLSSAASRAPAALARRLMEET
jgi:DNA-directed RNA polymerase specialized sigma24 family protein